MKIHHIRSIVLLGAALLLSARPGLAAPLPKTPEPPDAPLAPSGGTPEPYPFDLKEVVGRSARSKTADTWWCGMSVLELI